MVHSLRLQSNRSLRMIPFLWMIKTLSYKKNSALRLRDKSDVRLSDSAHDQQPRRCLIQQIWPIHVGWNLKVLFKKCSSGKKTI